MNSEIFLVVITIATFGISLTSLIVYVWYSVKRLHMEMELLKLKRKQLLCFEKRKALVGKYADLAGQWKLLKIFVATSILIGLTFPVSVWWWGMSADQLWKWVLTEYAHGLVLYAGMKLWKRIRPDRCQGMFA